MYSDDGRAILIDIISSDVIASEEISLNMRFVLGYVKIEFKELKIKDELTLKIYFQRDNKKTWEHIKYYISPTQKIYFFALPQGLTVFNFYVELYGEIYFQGEDPLFILTNFEVFYKIIPVGKYGNTQQYLVMRGEGGIFVYWIIDFRSISPDTVVITGGVSKEALILVKYYAQDNPETIYEQTLPNTIDEHDITIQNLVKEKKYIFDITAIDYETQLRQEINNIVITIE